MKLHGGSKYTPELAREICERMADGETLRQVCKSPHMPAASTVRGWVLDDVDGFAERYARARSLLLERWADETIEISDDGSNDWMEREAESGRIEIKCDHENVQRSRLRVDSRKWMLSKLRPETYGDRTAIDLNAKISETPDDQLDTRIAEYIRKAGIAGIAGGAGAPGETPEAEDV